MGTEIVVHFITHLCVIRFTVLSKRVPWSLFKGLNATLQAKDNEVKELQIKVAGKTSEIRMEDLTLLIGS